MKTTLFHINESSFLLERNLKCLSLQIALFNSFYCKVNFKAVKQFSGTKISLKIMGQKVISYGRDKEKTGFHSQVSVALVS